MKPHSTVYAYLWRLDAVREDFFEDARSDPATCRLERGLCSDYSPRPHTSLFQASRGVLPFTASVSGRAATGPHFGVIPGFSAGVRAEDAGTGLPLGISLVVGGKPRISGAAGPSKGLPTIPTSIFELGARVCVCACVYARMRTRIT